MSETGQAESIADRSFRLALAAWGEADDQALRRSLEPGWRDALRTTPNSSPCPDTDSALAALRREHRAQVRPDLGRVHPSWCLRGLRGESPAVRRAALRCVPEPLRETLRRGLGLPEAALTPDSVGVPDCARWVATLWAERLVGDVPRRADDPPVVGLLTATPPRTAVRVVRAVGLAKWAASRTAPARLSPFQQERFRSFRAALAPEGPRLQDFADRDVASLRGQRRHAWSRLGTATVARLLALTDPYRARWVLQHLPYPTAKLIRSLMPPKPASRASWIEWETRVFEVATTGLRGGSTRTPVTEGPA